MLTKRTRLAAVFVASLALTAIGAPAHAAPASLLSVGPGSIVADGAAVDVPITFVCDSDPSLVIATPLMELSQRVRGGRIAHGFGNDEVTCTRQAQTVTIRIIPGAMAFNPGEAVVSVTLLTCKVQFECAIAAFDNEIELSSTNRP
jgi:hypothetical protein